MVMVVINHKFILVEMDAKGTFLARLRSSLTKLLKILRFLFSFAETEDALAINFSYGK